MLGGVGDPRAGDPRAGDPRHDDAADGGAPADGDGRVGPAPMTTPPPAVPALAVPAPVAPPAGLSLAADFPPASRDDWRALVRDVLVKGRRADRDLPLADAEARLAGTTYDGISVAPLSTAADVGPLTGAPGLAPFVRGGRVVGSAAGGWDVRARHADPDPALTAPAIIADLEHGVTSLWLVLGEGGLPVVALPEVLADVLLDLAPVVLDAGARTPAAVDTFAALIAARGVPPAQVRGNLGADPLGLAARTGGTPDLTVLPALAERARRDLPGMRVATVDALVYAGAGGSDAQELAYAAATGLAYLRALTGGGLSTAAAFGQLEFRYAATAEQFATIAKLRAARRIWARIAEVCGLDDATGDPAAADDPTTGGAGPVAAQRQHAVTSPTMMTRRDPWVNLLRTTVAGFAAGVGGADAVTVLPFDTELGLPDPFSRRIARNTQALLTEESSLARVADPAGGSWHVESLTEALAEAAWARFTAIERSGGMAAALASGLVAEQLAEVRARRQADVEHRRAPITGVSEFPNVAEILPPRRPAAPGPSGGLPRFRPAGVFEQLRDRVDAAVQIAAGGARPAVFLATLGPAAASTARATFAANLFQAGGLVTPDSGAGADPEQIAAAFTASGATVACLCSSDKIYAASAVDVARALRAAGARRVWLAGQPDAADREAFTAAGIDGFVFTGCDAAEVLRVTLTELEVA